LQNNLTNDIIKILAYSGEVEIREERQIIRNRDAAPCVAEIAIVKLFRRYGKMLINGLSISNYPELKDLLRDSGPTL
jgi:hypothetical protein